MRVDKEARQPGRKMLPVYQDIEQMLGHVKASHPVSCKEGCDHCCHQLILITMPEALALAEEVFKHPQKIPEIMRRCEETLRHYDTLDAGKFYEKQVPCVFLEDHRCSVYGVRPVTCRTHIVGTPPENCASGATDPIVGKYDLKAVTVAALEEANRAWQQRRICPPLLAPMPVAVAWAMRLLAEGESAFKKAIEAEDLGILDIKQWTADIIRVFVMQGQQEQQQEQVNDGISPSSTHEVGAGQSVEG